MARKALRQDEHDAVCSKPDGAVFMNDIELALFDDLAAGFARTPATGCSGDTAERVKTNPSHARRDARPLPARW